MTLNRRQQLIVNTWCYTEPIRVLRRVVPATHLDLADHNHYNSLPLDWSCSRFCHVFRLDLFLPAADACHPPPTRSVGRLAGFLSTPLAAGWLDQPPPPLRHYNQYYHNQPYSTTTTSTTTTLTKNHIHTHTHIHTSQNPCCHDHSQKLLNDFENIS